MTDLAELRRRISDLDLASEAETLKALQHENPVSQKTRARAFERASEWVRDIRNSANPGLMEVFLAEYGLSSREGVALMCLAEALLRVPDADTIDALIEDKIAPSAWGSHLGKSSSSMVNASTWALMMTGKVLSEDEGEGLASVLHNTIKRLGEPVIRTAVGRAIRELGHQFVLGRSIGEALSRGRKLEQTGYTFSYDMLGEAALTSRDARTYLEAYSAAIASLNAECGSDDIRENPGISVKLSALHPRYEQARHDRVMHELVPRAQRLARKAARAGMGFNIDAEEADRLELSLDVIEAVLRDPDLEGWDGFGVVVQAYSQRAGAVIDWLHALAGKLDRRIMVRLAKGAYWDTEIKRAQVAGRAGFPVFTRKAASDVSYLCCAAKLLNMRERIYPQFATHNAHTVATIVEMAKDDRGFEFQRLQGMGEALHELVLNGEGTRCRIYAPVGTHRDLLAYLVRRLLENGANSSFVNQIVDTDVPVKKVAADPFETLATLSGQETTVVVPPGDIYLPERRNSRGWELSSHADLDRIERARAPFRAHQWTGVPLVAGPVEGGQIHTVMNPADPRDRVGQVTSVSERDARTALGDAQVWDAEASTRRHVLERASDLFEARFGEIHALLCREAGKTLPDAISELREAVDFLRYYALEAERLGDQLARGLFSCISPWNFPLAIFTGQIAAALAAGNGVLAKPAEPTSLTAHLAVTLLHEAGVPRECLQLLPGRGSVLGPVLTGDGRVQGVCFTGSTETAQRINRTMAVGVDPSAPLIAETGGLNAMIVDSTALPEQAIRDIVVSAFQSAGQRCSALRMLYLQQDIADRFLEMLFGAMDELAIGDPWSVATDVGPVINESAKAEINAHIETARTEGRLLKRLQVPESGTFVSPAVIRVDGIRELESEVFGPVLHVATFCAPAIDTVVDEINATGYGLTFGMHSRIDDRVEQVISRIKAGNIYVNRNQIGAVVGSQPFGGERLSGTGPKAGGPDYVARFKVFPTIPNPMDKNGPVADVASVEAALLAAARDRELPVVSQGLPGPTGESNQLTVYGRGTVLCLGPTAQAAEKQANIARKNGCSAVQVAPGAEIDGMLAREALATLKGVDLVALWSDVADLAAARAALASRSGPLIGLATGLDLAAKCRLERHVCIDTTAAGGNAALLASVR